MKNLVKFEDFSFKPVTLSFDDQEGDVHVPKPKKCEECECDCENCDCENCDCPECCTDVKNHVSYPERPRYKAATGKIKKTWGDEIEEESNESIRSRIKKSK